jgi:organic radical activating enzyme
MTMLELIDQYQKIYDVVAVINLDQCFDVPFYQREIWLKSQIEPAWRNQFTENQRVIFTMTQGEEYSSQHSQRPNILSIVQKLLNEVDISNCFVIVLTNDCQNVESQKQYLKQISTDSTAITWYVFDDPPWPGSKHVKSLPQDYEYNSSRPVKIDLSDLDIRQQNLLMQSKVFCMYPWVHLHAYPTGEAWPCCQSEMKAGAVGNCKTHTLSEIWNNTRMKELRVNMLTGIPDPLCVRCYEQEDSGFFSGRQSANKHHGHHIGRVAHTAEDGHLSQFSLTYWDIRFSNLCNLRCRSCGHIFSSQWYQDQAKLAGHEWKSRNQVLNYAGRTELDMWEQLEPHLDCVEQIYFAGGEPLLMEEHYRILDELVKRKLFHVRLIYNTNFTHTDLKGRSVFEYWKQFHSVSVGASLDAQEEKAEYIRKGTDWAAVEQNRRDMLAICPEVDFYVSPTLSVLNAWHLPDFHRSWVDKGLIRAQDLNVNILQDPAYYRIDIAPMEYKQRLRVKFEEHLDWLRSRDPLQRATVGFTSAIKFMMATDNSHLLDKFWSKTKELDAIRGENILQVLPELEAMQ